MAGIVGGAGASAPSTVCGERRAALGGALDRVLIIPCLSALVLLQALRGSLALSCSPSAIDVSASSIPLPMGLKRLSGIVREISRSSDRFEPKR
jgi:hypothetical protein